MNFLDDIRDQLVTILAAEGHTVASGAKVDDVATMLFNLQRRRIHPAPRKVERSRELVARWTALKADERSCIDHIESLVLSGADLTPHLSDRVKQPRAADLTLFEWGIYHLHLGLPGGKPRRAGFVPGAKVLLFAFVTDETVYFVDLLDHKAWAKQVLVEIIHANWPAAIADRILEGFVPLPVSEERRIAFRKMRVVGEPVVMPDGTVYATDPIMMSIPPMAFSVRRRSDIFLTSAVRVQRRCEAAEINLLRRISEATGRPLAKLELRFAVQVKPTGGLGYYIEEMQTGFRFWMP